MRDRMKNPFPTGSAEAFFFDNAGYSYDPKTETRKQGLTRCAQSMAKAERYARENDWQFEWEDDWSIGSHKEFYGKGSAYEDGEPNTCECCVVRDSEGEVLASLSCIDDADSKYRRVVEAELASEALHHVERKTARELEMDVFLNRSFAL